MITQVWPSTATGPLDEDGVERLYTYPAGPWLTVNYVSSVDGAVEIEGHSAGLTNPTDRVVYRLGSDLADVVLLGAGTATGEGFTGMHPDETTAARRARHGLAPVAPIAVVTSSGGSLPADAPVLTDAEVPTVVLTCASVDADLRAAWADAGAEVLITGDDAVDGARAVGLLRGRGLERIDCEGGPTLFGSLLADGLVDELRLSLAPQLVAGQAGRIATNAGMDPARLTLDSVLTEDDTLLLRYLVRR